MTFDEFKEVYKEAWANGCKGITTFRAAGKRYGILQAPVESEETPSGEAQSVDTENSEAATACFFDPNTGLKSCE